MNKNIKKTDIHAALIRCDGFDKLKKEDLIFLPTKGLVHDHVRISSSSIYSLPMIIRIPRLSQFALNPLENLEYQAACFSQASLSSHTPKLMHVLKPDEYLPMGALIVEEISGKNIQLPKHLNAMAECFARVHSLRIPTFLNRRPLIYHTDPISGVIGTINMQAKFICSATDNKEVQQLLSEELDWADKFASSHINQHPAPRLCLTDTHPGNFMINRKGKVYFVDLEKALYGSPGIDLGHATILTSTLWDFDVQVRLSRSDIVAFYDAYLNALPKNLKDEIKPWLIPMRRLAWLRSVTWSCKWFAEQHKTNKTNKTNKFEEGFRAKVQSHVTKRLSAFVDLETIQLVRSEWTGGEQLVLN